MISLEAWRASIGLFNHFSSSKAIHRSSEAIRDVLHGKQVGVTDVLLAYACLCCLTAFVYNFQDNVHTAVVSPFTKNYQLTSTSTMNYSETMFTRDGVSSSMIDKGVTPIDPAMAAKFALLVLTLHSLYSSFRLLLSGDVERNPGPGDDKTNVEQVVKRLENKLDQKIAALESKMNRVLEAVENQGRTLEQKITDSHNKLQDSHNKLQDSIAQLHEDMTTLRETVDTNTQAIASLSADQQASSECLTDLQDEMERFERHSRRNNIRLFGIPEAEGERYDTCAEKVAEVLNKYFTDTHWTKDHVERAHRLGPNKPNSRYPRPMIAKFQKWGDVMSVMQDRDARAAMQEDGMKITSDLTRRQSAQLKALRDQGKFGYFVKGKLQVRDRDDTRVHQAPEGTAAGGMSHSAGEVPPILGEQILADVTDSRGSPSTGGRHEFPLPSPLRGKPRTRSTTSSTGGQSTLTSAWQKVRDKGRPPHEKHGNQNGK